MNETRLKVFLSSPYSHPLPDGREANMLKSFAAARVLFEHGHEPFIPLLFHVYEVVHPHRTWEQWIETCKTWLQHCDAVVRLPGESRGADLEVEYAQQLGIPVYFGMDHFISCTTMSSE